MVFWRCCARWMHGVLIAGALALAPPLLTGCAKADGGAVPLAAPPALTLTSALARTGATYFAPGDTVGWGITWSVPSATVPPGYSYAFSTSVAATNGTWSVIYGTTACGPAPCTGATAVPGPVALKLTAIPWDSVSPTFCVWGVAGTRVSAQQCATWKVYRKLPPPGLPKVDSSTTVTGMLVAPNPVTLTLQQSRLLCAFKTFATGAVTEWTADRAACDSLYVAYVPAASRSLVTVAQQAHTDSLTATCVSWSTASPAVALVAGPCASAVRVTAVALTMRPDAIRSRYADTRTDPVGTVSPTGVVRCLRGGALTVTATADNGVAGSLVVYCPDPVLERLAGR